MEQAQNFFYVYQYQCTHNGKKYIGKTDNLDRRHEEHTEANGHCPVFHAAIRKYGIASFELNILGTYDTESEAFEAEKHFIAEFKTNIKRYGAAYGYNLTDGGEGPSGYRFTDEQLRRLSDSHIGQQSYWKGKKLSDEHRQNLSKSHQGYVMPDTQKQNISAANIGRPGKPWSEERKKQVSEAMKGRDMSEMTKLAAEATKGKPKSEEHKQRISKAHKGKTLTEEHKRACGAKHSGKTWKVVDGKRVWMDKQ